MNIYLPTSSIQQIPENFTAIAIHLDAGVKSLLEWHQEIEEANEWTAKGARLFWVLDMHLFDQCQPTEPHLQILLRAVEHFEQVIWNRFKEVTIGVCLYQGTCLLEELQVAFLEQLSGSLPDGAEPFLLLDGSAVPNPIAAARCLSKERFPHFTLAVKGVDLPLQEYGWESNSGPRGFIGKQLESQRFESPKTGVCIPFESSSDALEEIVKYLQENRIAFRLIPEALITTDWEGLDDIIVDSELCSPQSIRKLRGFCAAGGTVVVLGQPLQLPLEIGVEEWKSNFHTEAGS